MYQTSPERASALQKYLLLHSQHDALQKHLNHISISNTTSPSESPERAHRTSSFSSVSSDELSFPPRGARHHYRSNSTSNRRPQRPQMVKRRSSLPAVINETILEEIEEEESKLKDVNQQIKSTLTDLLNCKGVRSDQRYRTWVQTRLMDTEKELKNSRSRNCERRRSEDFGGMLF
ncbi:hypothetical protein BGZ60DRAFT_363240 [Tricladium varicosporioides]|nr:hypothetical protein BGZ60DRAFT_363240 [Hymenoscyphus varicosporioides]